MIKSIHKVNRDQYDVFFDDGDGLAVDQCNDTTEFQRFPWKAIKEALRDSPELLDAPLPEPAPPTQEQINAEAEAELKRLDAATIRCLRAIQSGRGTQADTDRLLELETKAEAARSRIK